MSQNNMKTICPCCGSVSTASGPLACSWCGYVDRGDADSRAPRSIRSMVGKTLRRGPPAAG